MISSGIFYAVMKVRRVTRGGRGGGLIPRRLPYPEKFLVTRLKVNDINKKKKRTKN